MFKNPAIEILTTNLSERRVHCYFQETSGGGISADKKLFKMPAAIVLPVTSTAKHCTKVVFSSAV
jgi:hypothetical protein